MTKFVFAHFKIQPGVAQLRVDWCFWDLGKKHFTLQKLILLSMFQISADQCLLDLGSLQENFPAAIAGSLFPAVAIVYKYALMPLGFSYWRRFINHYGQLFSWFSFRICVD